MGKAWELLVHASELGTACCEALDGVVDGLAHRSGWARSRLAGKDC
jgi:hypothetical protein